MYAWITQIALTMKLFSHRSYKLLSGLFAELFCYEFFSPIRTNISSLPTKEN